MVVARARIELGGEVIHIEIGAGSNKRVTFDDRRHCCHVADCSLSMTNGRLLETALIYETDNNTSCVR